MLALFDLHPFFFNKDIFSRLYSNIFQHTNSNFVCIESGLTTPLRANIETIIENKTNDSYLVWSNLRQLKLFKLDEILNLLLPLCSSQTKEKLFEIYVNSTSIEFSYSELDLITQNLARWDYNQQSIGSLFAYIESVTRFWIAYYTYFDIDIIFGHICHSGEDLIGLFVAKYLNIKFYSFNTSCTDGIFILDNMTHKHLDLSCFMSNNSSSRSHLKYIKSKTEIPSFGIKQSYSKYRVDFNYNHWKQAQKSIFQMLTQTESQAAALHLNLLTQEYIKHSSSIQNLVKSNDEKYVIFLQMQPEATSVPCGLELNSQFKLIQKVRSIIPKSAKLLVKEHTGQFAVFQEIPHTNELDSRILKDVRPLNFYKQIKDLGNTYLVDIRTNSSDLLGSHTTLFTSVGTCGIEFYLSGSKIYQFKSLSPYAQFFEKYGQQNHSTVSRADLLIKYFDDHSFEISQFLGYECQYTMRELFSTEFFKVCSEEERSKVVDGLSKLISFLFIKSKSQK